MQFNFVTIIIIEVNAIWYLGRGITCVLIFLDTAFRCLPVQNGGMLSD